MGQQAFAANRYSVRVLASVASPVPVTVSETVSRLGCQRFDLSRLSSTRTGPGRAVRGRAGPALRDQVDVARAVGGESLEGEQAGVDVGHRHHGDLGCALLVELPRAGSPRTAAATRRRSRAVPAVPCRSRTRAVESTVVTRSVGPAATGTGVGPAGEVVGGGVAEPDPAVLDVGGPETAGAVLAQAGRRGGAVDDGDRLLGVLHPARPVRVRHEPDGPQRGGRGVGGRAGHDDREPGAVPQHVDRVAAGGLDVDPGVLPERPVRRTAAEGVAVGRLVPDERPPLAAHGPDPGGGRLRRQRRPWSRGRLVPAGVVSSRAPGTSSPTSRPRATGPAARIANRRTVRRRVRAREGQPRRAPA